MSVLYLHESWLSFKINVLWHFIFQSILFSLPLSSCNWNCSWNISNYFLLKQRPLPSLSPIWPLWILVLSPIILDIFASFDFRMLFFIVFYSTFMITTSHAIRISPMWFVETGAYVHFLDLLNLLYIFSPPPGHVHLTHQHWCPTCSYPWPSSGSPPLFYAEWFFSVVLTIYRQPPNMFWIFLGI